MNRYQLSRALGGIAATLNLFACTDHMTVGYRTSALRRDAGLTDLVIGCTEEIRLAAASDTEPRAVEMVPRAYAC